ncbi:MAG: hypothetical protein Q9227_000775 [Pyrenula ochraceoflavens]
METVTVGMSALCQENPRRVSRLQDTSRTYELRTVPQYYEYQGAPSGVHAGDSSESQVTRNVYGNLLTNWIYSATLQLTLNDLKPAWVAKDWSFVPLDSAELAQLGDETTSESVTAHQTPLSGPLTNATFETPALRARLECSPYHEILNQSSWLRTEDLTNSSKWNVNVNPRGLKTGYELTDTSDGSSGPYRGTYLPLGNQMYATFYAHESQLICCANETNDGPGKAAIGYWSKQGPPDLYTSTNFSVMWLVGNPMEQLYEDKENLTHFIWSEPPELTGINCLPVIESADAEITVDTATKTVQSYTISGNPKNYTAAWHDRYVGHNRSTDNPGPPPLETYSEGPQGNLTASFGFVFLDALLGSSTVSSNTADPTTGVISGTEDLDDRTFNFRTKGRNMDFMSYSMLKLANDNVDTLSDPETLARLASNVFSVFFQHFVAYNISDAGGWAYQTIGAKLPPDLGCPVANLYDPDSCEKLPPLPQSTTNRTVTVHLHHRVQSIGFSEAAVWLCVSILAFLGVATILVFGLARNHFKALPRDVDTIASVLGFVYGSSHLLAWVRQHVGQKDWGQKSASSPPSSRKHKYVRPSEQNASSEPLVQMGSFTGKDGKNHWGIEIVNTNAEEERVWRTTRAEDVPLEQISARPLLPRIQRQDPLEL